MRSRSNSRRNSLRRKVRRPTSLVILMLAALLPVSAWALEFRSVAAPKAILFDAPSAQARKLSIVTQSYPVEIIVDLGAWIKVRDARGGLAWIESGQLAETRMVLVTVPEAKAYDRAGPDARLVFRAANNVVLEMLEPAAGGWVKVRHRDGLVGYIQSTEVWGL